MGGGRGSGGRSSKLIKDGPGAQTSASPINRRCSSACYRVIDPLGAHVLSAPLSATGSTDVRRQ